MGLLSILGSTGHVEVKWNDKSINIELNPEEGKATTAEHARVAKFVKSAAGNGFGVFLKTGRRFAKATPEEIDDISTEVSSIRLDKENQQDIQDLVQGMVCSDICASHLVFQLDKKGKKGKLVQKKDFLADGKEYLATTMVKGG